MSQEPATDALDTSVRKLNPRSNNFGILRVALASLVIFGHGPELADGDRHHELLTKIFGTMSLGQLAVNGFFLISGFLIVKSWVTKPHLGVFLANRVLRIYPAFAVASVVCTFLIGPCVGLGHVDALRQTPSLIKHIALLDQPSYPVPLAFKHYGFLDGAMWTIQWEFKCYLLVALMGLLGLTGRRLPWLLICVVTLGLTVYRDLHGVDEQSWARFVALFSTGSLFYLYREKVRYEVRFATPALVGLVAALFFAPTAQIGLALLGGYLLFSLAFADAPSVSGIGAKHDISYGLYLYAWPIQQLTLLLLPKLHLVIQILITLALSCVAGYLSWCLVERQAMKLKLRERPLASLKPVAVGQEG